MSNTLDSNTYEKQIFDSLPDSAKRFYVSKTNKTMYELCHQANSGEKAWKLFNLIRLYPLLSLKYLNSNEFACAIVNGEHRIFQGPGYVWVVGLQDRIVSVCSIGQDINFGPIKIIYVKPGTLKFAEFRNTGNPVLLGPGMHFFNDLNLELGYEVSMVFNGDNQTVNCDSKGAFKFVFVKTGSEAIIINKTGVLSTCGPGLHFIQAPDSLKSFVSVQQEHFKVSSVKDRTTFLTADNVELHITATVFYRIADVKTMFTTRIKDEKDLEETLHSQATATLLTIIRSESFQGIGQKQHVKRVQAEITRDGLGPENNMHIPVPITPSAPQFKDTTALESITMGFQNIIHDAEPQFVSLMQNNFGPSGIEIQSLRIEQIEFADKTMQSQVSEFALTLTRMTSQQQTITAQRAIQVAEAERESATLLIKTKAEADRAIMLKDSENEIKIRSAKAEAENKLILAEAEAKAKIRIGEAELQIQEKQNTMPNAALRIMTEAQVQALAGVSKIIYTDQQNMLMKPYYAIPDSTFK